MSFNQDFLSAPFLCNAHTQYACYCTYFVSYFSSTLCFSVFYSMNSTEYTLQVLFWYRLTCQFYGYPLPLPLLLPVLSFFAISSFFSLLSANSFLLKGLAKDAVSYTLSSLDFSPSWWKYSGGGRPHLVCKNVVLLKYTAEPWSVLFVRGRNRSVHALV